MPSFPFQGWMPDAYRTMPLPALAFFSGVVSKVAAYGFLKLVLPLFPAAVEDFHTILLILAIVSILYGSVQAFTQTNARLILGYSSIAQLGFITLGIFAIDAAGQGAQGALLQSVNHGLVVAPLFFVIVLLAERAEGSEDIRDYGGIAFRAPVLAVLFLIAALATLAMPGSANFAGEFLILLGAFDAEQAIAIIASIGVVLASVYALRMYIRSMHNRVGPRVESFEMTAARRARARPAGARHPRLRVVSAARAGVGRRGGQVDGAGGGGSMTPVFAQAAVKGPEINWEALSPFVALTAGALRRAAGRARALGVHPRHGRAGADARDLGRDRRARRLAVGRQRGDHRLGAGRRQPDAGAGDDLRRGRHRRRAAVVALGGDGGGGRRRVLRAAADLDPGHGRAGRGQRPGRALHRLRAALDPACTCCARRT